jgi:lipase maturation factor 1
MSSASPRRVANPPPKPLLLFDGDCHFCRRWIERWRGITGDAVDYASSQEAGARFPEITDDEFRGAVQLLEPSGEIYSAAHAVFRSLAYAPRGWWLLALYQRLPGFAWATELTYSTVAANRQLASAATRLLWGDDVRQPTYAVTRSIFLRLLGIVFLIAFVSLWTQVDGLIGGGGILPVAEFLGAVESHLGAKAPGVLPTLFWLNSSDTALHVVCGAGVAFSLALIAGLLPAVGLIGAFVCYLSLTIAGQTFLSFQWDILLLETGFLAIFFAPWSWLLRHRRSGTAGGVPLFLLKLLLFKLMLMSGVVKLTSGDVSWWDLTAMNYHYETQPLPTTLGWWAHQAPEWFGKTSTVVVLAVELVAPFFIWAPRRLRLLAAGLLIGLQVLIALTGNYAFFNLLTIVLCLLLIDDQVWRAVLRKRTEALPLGHPRPATTRLRHWAAAAVLLVTLPVNAWLIFSAFKPEASPPRWITALEQKLQPFHIVSGYGLFRVMTKERAEILLEGSRDGIDWVPYEFRWKPGALDGAPRRVAPHQPRLDWQMWFAALGSYQQNRWFVSFAARLLENAPAVTGLLAKNPFADAPPTYLRARLYEYEFTSRAERQQTGAWWRAEERREYLPTISLKPQ